MGLFLVREHIDDPEEKQRSDQEWVEIEATSAENAALEFFDQSCAGSISLDVLPCKPTVFDTKLVRRGK